MHAEHFTITRTVSTGSWVGVAHQGRGIGKEMRVAVVHLAFDGLGVEIAETSALANDPASIAVTTARVRAQRSSIDVREGQPVRHPRFVLTRERWLERRRHDISYEHLERNRLQYASAMAHAGSPPPEASPLSRASRGRVLAGLAAGVAAVGAAHILARPPANPNRLDAALRYLRSGSRAGRVVEHDLVWAGPVAAGCVLAILILLGRHRDVAALTSATGVVLVSAGAGLWTRTVVISGPAQVGTMSGRPGRSVPLLAGGALVLLTGLTIGAIRPARGGPARATLGILAATAAGLFAVSVMIREVTSFVGAVDGRPRRRHGRREKFAPTPDAPPSAVPWLRMADEEAASVGAFLELAARLERVNAPKPLVLRCHVAAGDERRHARLCDREARRLGAHPPTRSHQVALPGPRPARAVEIVQLAVESYVDGVLGEGAAATRIELAAANFPVLERVAADERGHARLAADIIEWCASRQPAAVGLALWLASRRSARVSSIRNASVGWMSGSGSSVMAERGDVLEDRVMSNQRDVKESAVAATHLSASLTRGDRTPDPERFVQLPHVELGVVAARRGLSRSVPDKIRSPEKGS